MKLTKEQIEKRYEEMVIIFGDEYEDGPAFKYMLGELRDAALAGLEAGEAWKQGAKAGIEAACKKYGPDWMTSWEDKELLASLTPPDGKGVGV